VSTSEYDEKKFQCWFGCVIGGFIAVAVIQQPVSHDTIHWGQFLFFWPILTILLRAFLAGMRQAEIIEYKWNLEDKA